MGVNSYNDRAYCSADCVNSNCYKNVLGIDVRDFLGQSIPLVLLDFSHGCDKVQHASNEWCEVIEGRLKLFGVEL